jgi:hypothetical protein
LCRISIDIPNTLDIEWQIDVRKASAKIPDVIRKRIRDICISSLEKSIKVYTTRGPYLRRDVEKKEIVYLWLAKQRHGVKNYYINVKHPLFEMISDHLSDDSVIFKDYMKLVAESIPVNMIANDFSDPEIVIETPLHNKTDVLEKIFESALAVLCSAGLSTEQAKIQLHSMEVFQQLTKKK